jgi:DNA-binding protein YbaB
MDAKTVLAKTAKGREEVETRKYKLEQRVRVVLITINGKSTVADLSQQFSNTSDIQGVLERLVREGFVEAAGDPAERLQRAKTQVSSLISGALGPESEAIALKVEASRSMEELRAYLESRRALLDSALGKTRAEAFWAQVASLTG